MPKLNAPLLRRAHRGQKGVTLIELLIVIAILGVIVGIIIYAVGPFRGAGTLQAAQTESHGVRTAVEAYLAHGGDITVTDGVMGSSNGPSRNCTGFPPNDDGWTPITYFDGNLKAQYNINVTDVNCIITSADPSGTGNWGTSITWDYAICEWKKV